MILKLTLLILALLTSISVFSQERKIVGRILDLNTQKPLKEANIVIFGTTTGTFSNHLGFFELSVDASKHEALVASCIGFKTSVVSIPTEDRFKFFLEKEYILLDEINLGHFPRNVTNNFKPAIPNPKTDNELVVIESGALFPNGIDNFYDFIGNSLKSELSLINGQEFTISFTINERGQASEISISDSTDLIQRVVNQTFQKMTNWIPATQRQIQVSQHFILPIVNHEIPDVKSLDFMNFYTFISGNIKYPAQARRMGVEGAVYVEFQIDNSGNIISIKPLTDIGAGCGDEVSRVIATTPTELTKSLFEQAHFNKFILPVCFGLDSPFKPKQFTPNSNALVLTAVAVTAIGFEREKRVVGYPTGLSSSSMFPVKPAINNTFNSLSKALDEPRFAKKLFLTNSGLNLFPLEILKLTNLEFLDLEKNEIKRLPNEIELLTKLQELYLFENQIEDLPMNFGNLKKLKILGLGSNQINSFPLELTYLEKLEALDLSDNEISILPPEIGNLKNLKTLIIQNNNISSIPKEFFQLKKLEKIYLQNNPIDPKDKELLKTTFLKAEIAF